MNTVEEVLKNCTIEGNIVKLPVTQLDRKTYQEVAKKLELIGGKWTSGKIKGFVFNENPESLLKEISAGVNRNLKKEFQFFGTPAELADELVKYADIKQYHKVLEPSAGQGAIIKAINRVYPKLKIDCFELMSINRTFLNKISTANLIGEDFLESEVTMSDEFDYDRIVANPPFSKNQDIEHVYLMYDMLKEGGRLVSITSKHWEISSNKKETEFREWLGEIGAEIISLDEGKFKKSGTMIETNIIIINK
jgi:hypothetical protein